MTGHDAFRARLGLLWREQVAFLGRPAFGWGVATVVTGLVAFALDLGFALALQRFLAAINLIDAGARAPMFGPLHDAYVEMAAFLVVGTFRTGVMWANSYATGACQVAFETRCRLSIFEWAVSSGRVSLGEVATLFNDVVIGAAAVVSGVFYMASRIVLAGATFMFLAIQSPLVTLGIAVTVAMAIPAQRLIDRRLNAVSTIIQQSLAAAMSRLSADVKNALFVHVHGLVAHETERGAASIRAYSVNSGRYYMLSSARSAVPQFVGLIVVAAIALGGSATFGDDRGAIVAYLYLALRLFQSLSEMARVSANIRVNRARFRVLDRWWREDARPAQVAAERTVGVAAGGLPAEAVGWRLDNVGFAWETGRPILSGVNLDLEPGHVTIIVGPSGSGKSTLMMLLIGMIEPTEGEVRVRFAGETLTMGEARARLLASTAYVGPDPFVVPGTVRDFLVYGLATPPSEAEIKRALEMAHCEFLAAMPGYLDHRLTEQGEGLSAGQKQRLSLARALLRRPRVLLLDEATANLDSETERGIVATLAELKGQLSIVAVTHRTELRAIADQVIELDGNGVCQAAFGMAARHANGGAP